MTETTAEAFWDDRYRSHPAVWSGDPNPQLVAEASDLRPGTALDVGCGEGADAVWLARRGWRVTAVDVSGVALERAAERAEEADPEAAGRITWLRADATAWRPEPGSADLVAALFLHLPGGQRRPALEGLAAAVAPGGALLVVGHHPSDLATTVRRPQDPDLYATAEELAAALEPDRWEVVTAAAPARVVTDPAGAAATVHDAVLRAHRRR